MYLQFSPPISFAFRLLVLPAASRRRRQLEENDAARARRRGGGDASDRVSASRLALEEAFAKTGKPLRLEYQVPRRPAVYLATIIGQASGPMIRWLSMSGRRRRSLKGNTGSRSPRPPDLVFCTRTSDSKCSGT